MYKILIKYNDEHNLWKVHGTETTISSGCSTTTQFVEYDTDNKERLQEEVLKLDAKFGHENIKVVKDITSTFSVDIATEED